MQLSRIFFRIALLLFPAALIGTTWLYLYPVFHSCGFPTPPSTYARSTAPFRILSLGDPQLEGDSSLPDPDARIFPSVEFLIPHVRNATTLRERRDVVMQAATGVVQDVLRWLEGKRKAVDLWGNDWYLAHIVRSLRWWTAPTHISVLGDLLGSQWVTDGEFRQRAGRYWRIVMRGLQNVPDRIFGVEEVDRQDEAQGELVEGQDHGGGLGDQQDRKRGRKTAWGGTTEVLGADDSWAKRVINIAGNHDIGYAGDIDESRIDRFEKAFGSVNWDIWFTLPDHLRRGDSPESPTGDPLASKTLPALRIVVLNSMNFDTPAWSSDLQAETYSFTNHIITNSRPVTDKTHATILLTHIPLEKDAGVCVDSPFFDFFENGYGVREQNMLSDHASKIVLEGIFGMSGDKDAFGAGLGRRGIVLNGHDHAGCDVVHYMRQPGVDGGCDVNTLRQEEAYWPTRAANESISITTVDDDILEVNEASHNDTNEAEAPAHAPVPSSSTAPPTWKAHRFPLRPYDVNAHNVCAATRDAPTLREITLRSMMGEFSGYAGFLSAWFDYDVGEEGEWVFAFSSCGVGVQHWWWGVHVLDLLVVVCVGVGGMMGVVEGVGLGRRGGKEDARVGKEKVVRGERSVGAVEGLGILEGDMSMKRA